MLWAGLAAVSARARQEPSEQKAPEAFFAGIVTERATEKITVSRLVLGKTEYRTFRITPETKTEGTLRVNVRVTVRYVSGEDGDTATLIVVRPPQKK